jgi:hypothetical protein
LTALLLALKKKEKTRGYDGVFGVASLHGRGLGNTYSLEINNKRYLNGLIQKWVRK